MTKSEMLRAAYEANIACGDISEAAEAAMLREIASARLEEERMRLRARLLRVSLPQSQPHAFAASA